MPANFLTNGDFEGSGSSPQNNAAPPGWFVDNLSPDVNVNRVGAGGAASSGSNWIWAADSESIGQNLAPGNQLIAGTTYKFSLDVDPGEYGGATTVNIYLRDQSGNLLATISVASDSISGNYTTHTVLFTPTVTVTGVEIAVGDPFVPFGVSQVAALDNAQITVCFAAGSRITTQFGPVAVQDLSVGDMVITKDHGAQPIRWIGSNKRPAVDNIAPILIKKGALGNRHDLRVSPQHRMLVRGKRVQEMCGKGAVLVPAKALVDGQDIIVDLSEPTVDYFHIAFDQHEIIYAEGIPSESLYLGGAEAWKMLHPAQRAELRTIFPDIDPENPSQAYGPTARLSLGKSKAERMLALH